MSGRVDVTSPSPTPEAWLSHLLPALWKSLWRVTRGSERMPALESEVSVLRMLVDMGPLTPARLAERLHLARPTVSNLLKSLESSGLVRRDRSEADGRSVIISPTEYGREVLEQFRHGRTNVLAAALDGLSPRERRTLVNALPVMDHLLESIEELGSMLPPEERRPA